MRTLKQLPDPTGVLQGDKPAHHAAATPGAATLALVKPTEDAAPASV